MEQVLELDLVMEQILDQLSKILEFHQEVDLTHHLAQQFMSNSATLSMSNSVQLSMSSNAGETKTFKN